MSEIKFVKATITNNSGGPKVLNARPVVTLQDGETADDVEISEAELSAAATTGWFEIEGDEPAAEPGPLDQSVERLTAYLADVTDADQVQKLIDAETAGKSRAGAIAALEARRDALLA